LILLEIHAASNALQLGHRAAVRAGETELAAAFLTAGESVAICAGKLVKAMAMKRAETQPETES